jgi:hypothetical protein
VASFETELVDVGPERLGDPQPVQREEGAQGVVLRAGQAGGDEERSWDS